MLKKLHKKNNFYSKASEYYTVPVPTVFRSSIFCAHSIFKNTKIYRFPLENRDPYRFKAFRYSFFKNHRKPYRTKKLIVLR